MCGFAGEFRFTPQSADLELAATMATTLRHRGGDEAGRFLSQDRRCAIGFRCLAVIDPPGSHQPMVTADGDLAVAFNGEIYNFRSLREELTRDGAVFQTAGDTEVLLHLYRRYGQEMVHRLDGMFAFALYDGAAKRLILTRDRLGQKPLWYADLGKRLLFASEAKALLACPSLSRNIELQAITSYMTMGYIASPTAAWAAIRKLPPGNTLTAADWCPPPQAYWAPEPLAAPPERPRCIERVRAEVTCAVEARMVADVPLGALLSGGLDSSIIVALMSRAAGRTGGVRTFTAAFADDKFDERPAARLVASHCGTDHTELLVESLSAEMLDAVVEMYDEPFADSSALPTWLICRAARQHVTVALAGDGGDEVFGGYDRYRALHLAQTMRPGQYLAARLAAAAIRPWASCDERSRLRRFLRFVDALPYPPAVQYFRYRSLFDSDDLKRLFTADFAASVDLEAPQRWFLDLYEEADLDNEVARAQRHDLLTYLPDDLLVKTDIASMAASLELRAPMLDHRVVSLGLSLPVDMKISRRRGKVILRKAFSDLLPPEVFGRPKRGFAVPLGRWLRTGLRETLRETLLDRAFLRRGIFREEALVGLINDHISGRDDHRHRLWALLILARWLARYG